MDNHDIAGQLAAIAAQLTALRADIDALRLEVRNENTRLRKDIATTLSRQNSVIADAKKKQTASQL